MRLRVKLGDYLSRHDISAYRLVREADSQLAKNTVYSYARGGVKRVDLEVLGVIMEKLESITGEPVSIDDLLEKVSPGVSAAGVPYTGHRATDEILDEQPDVLERIKRLERGEARLIPWSRVKEAQRTKRNLN
ncbi:MAG: hypothetical protein WD273_04950 [Trueperaceae bacterium]